MFLKAGVSIRGVQPEVVLALSIIESVYTKHSIPLTVTEITGGTHKAGSLHYVGLAADIRSSNVPPQIRDAFVEEIKEALGAEFDFIVEGDHFHVEFQPKTQIHG